MQGEPESATQGMKEIMCPSQIKNHTFQLLHILNMLLVLQQQIVQLGSLRAGDNGQTSHVFWQG